MAVGKDQSIDLITGLIVAVLGVAFVAALAVPIYYRRRKGLLPAQHMGTSARHLLPVPATTRGRSLTASTTASFDAFTTPPLTQDLFAFRASSPSPPRTVVSQPSISSLADHETPQTAMATSFQVPQTQQAFFVEPTLSQEQLRQSSIYSIKSPTASVASPTTQAALSALPGHMLGSSGGRFTHASSPSTSLSFVTVGSMITPTTQAQLTAMPSYALEPPPSVGDPAMLSPLTPETHASYLNSHRRTNTEQSIVSPLDLPMPSSVPHPVVMNVQRASYFEMESPVLPRSQHASFVGDAAFRSFDTTPPPERAFRYG